MSKWFQEYWYILIGGIGVVVAIIQGMKRSTKFAHFVDRLLLKIPVLGDILNKSAIARFARTLRHVRRRHAAGRSDARHAGNIVYYEAVMKMRDEIATGTQMQAAMRDVNVFPNMVIQMVAIGEESGALDSMLAKVADWYEQEVDDAVDSLTSLLEPMIMAVLGVIIGGLVVAMYLPIFKMGQVV